MRRLISLFTAAAVALSAVGVGSPAFARPQTQTEPFLVGPGIQGIRGPFDPALLCLRENLPPEQKQVVYGVLTVGDNTRRVNSVSDSGIGGFLPGYYDDALITALRTAGVRVAETSQPFTVINQQIRNIAPAAPYYGVAPAVAIIGSFNRFSVLPGGGARISWGGIWGGHTEHRFAFGLDARLVGMAFNSNVRAGEVIDSFSLGTQVVGFEDGVGITHFFGPPGSQQLVDAEIGRDGRGPMQHVAAAMMGAVAYLAIRSYSHYTGCDAMYLYSAQTSAIIPLTELPPLQPLPTPPVRPQAPPAPAPAAAPVPSAPAPAASLSPPAGLPPVAANDDSPAARLGLRGRQ